MKEIKTEDAIGSVLCHDITEIVKDQRKGPRFKKGHIIKEEDIEVLLNLGKEHLYVFEKDETMMHEIIRLSMENPQQKYYVIFVSMNI